jgi:hypothetical protein
MSADQWTSQNDNRTALMSCNGSRIYDMTRTIPSDDEFADIVRPAPLVSIDGNYSRRIGSRCVPMSPTEK